ncbi:uncharacterized protein LOC143461861 [Clavelina lepadiformis]|uniref:Uncharacterized protein n=1 Tax=Clavelina lepadiformis TaxID=159417 RepID=A0ABP0GKH9_CLALP
MAYYAAGQYGFATTANSGSASAPNFASQPYNYGYGNAGGNTSNTTTSQQYQQFSNLWYGHSASTTAQPQQQSQQHQQPTTNRPTQPPQQQQPQAHLAQQQHVAAYQAAQMNQFYQHAAFLHHPYHQQAAATAQTTSNQQYNKPPSVAKPAASSQAVVVQSGRPPASSAPPGHQRGADSSYQVQAKPATNWGSYGSAQQQGGKDWGAQQQSYQQQAPNNIRNGYSNNPGTEWNSQQSGTIQQQQQIFAQQHRMPNYQPNISQPYQGYQQNSPNQRGGNYLPDQNRNFAKRSQVAQTHLNANPDTTGSWNNTPQSNWNQSNQGNWGNQGWGDWGGQRGNVRRGNDDGPCIPPFPQQWQVGGSTQPPVPMNEGRGDQNKSWAGGNNWNQSWEARNNRPAANNNGFSRGDGQQQNKSQNHRYSPNSRRPQGEKTDRELWTPADTKRMPKDKLLKAKESMEEKPIQATEIKSYLYAWLGIRRMRPIYDIHAVGERPDQTFRCELRVGGYKFVGVGEAPSKKDAQTDAAWNFADFLVKQGDLKKTDLPPRLVIDEPNVDFGIVKEYDDEKDKRTLYRQGPRNTNKGPIPPLMSIITSPVGIPPFPDFEHGPEPWGMPQAHRRGRPWMDAPHGPWHDPPRGARGGWHRHHEPWRQREVEDHWMDEMRMNPDFVHPEDIFISRMIMHQQEAAMGGRKFNESRPGEWTSITPPRTRNVTTLDDRHVVGKHAAIYPHEEELKAVHEIVTIAERALKALSDQFVDEDHPLPKSEDEPEEEAIYEKGELDNEEKEETKEESMDEKLDKGKEEGSEDDDKSEKKAKIQILKRPKKKSRKVPDTRPRILSSVHRVGALAKGLLIHGDLNISLVLLCGSMPTKALLDRIMKNLPAKLEASEENLRFELKENEAGFTITGHLDAVVNLSVLLTCSLLKTYNNLPRNPEEEKEEQNAAKDDAIEEKKLEMCETENEDSIDTEDIKDQETSSEEITEILPKTLLLGALAQLRHVKWFQARASQQDCGVVITRIIRDLKQRNATWRTLSDWAVENLVYVSLSSSTEHMSPGDALRRFFEVIAGGILLPDRSGVQDPCEKSEVDVLDCCTEQELENITRIAQYSLLKIAFRQVHEVLGMEKQTITHRFNPHHHSPPVETTTVTNPAEVQIPNTTSEEEEKDIGRKRRLEHNSSDSLSESPKRTLTDEEDTDTQQNLAELTISDQTLAQSTTSHAMADQNDGQNEQVIPICSEAKTGSEQSENIQQNEPLTREGVNNENNQTKSPQGNTEVMETDN